MTNKKGMPTDVISLSGIVGIEDPRNPEKMIHVLECFFSNRDTFL